jgi:hypothetical protein
VVTAARGNRGRDKASDVREPGCDTEENGRAGTTLRVPDHRTPV